MNLKNRVEKIEEKMGSKEETLLVVVNTFPPEDEEGLDELPEDIEEWFTFKEQMKNPKVQPINNMRVFVKDYRKELEARRKFKERFLTR